MLPRFQPKPSTEDGRRGVTAFRRMIPCRVIQTATCHALTPGGSIQISYIHI